jgi:hypothetical protein
MRLVKTPTTGYAQSRGMKTNFILLVNQYRVAAFIDLVGNRGLDNFNQIRPAMD